MCVTVTRTWTSPLLLLVVVSFRRHRLQAILPHATESHLPICLSLRDVELSWSLRLEFFENNSRVSYLWCSLSEASNIKRKWEHPKILTQNDPTPVDLSVADIRWQIVAERSEISSGYRNGNNGEPIGNQEPTSLFPMVRWMTYYDLPLPKMGVAYKCTLVMSNFEWPYLRNGLSDPRSVLFYTVGHKKRDTFIFSITQTNIDRFS